MGELLVRYEESGIDERILRAVEEMGFVHMTPIQEKAIPVFLEGRDVIGQAQTGTGKTAAFGIPMLQKIDEEDRSLQGMILCPTRELAMQAAQQLRQFAKYMHNIRVLAVYGGQDINRQIKALKGGVQIIVGTPGRVMDHMRRHTIRLDNLKMVVLDEADEMLNMGFREDMEAILGQISVRTPDGAVFRNDAGADFTDHRSVPDRCGNGKGCQKGIDGRKNPAVSLLYPQIG